MSGEKKGKWEIRKIEETRRDGKKFWNVIRELLGKNKERDEETFVYSQEGVKKNIEEMTEEYMDKWKKEIYQKIDRVDFSFWYGTDMLRGKKEEMEQEELQENSGIMEKPIIEEEMMEVIKKMKNGKAAGVDGIRTELIKYITRNDSIRKHMVKCCNNVLNERVQEDWLKSNTTMVPKNSKPKILEHRPIAVMVISSKIMRSIYREKIEEHLKNAI